MGRGDCAVEGEGGQGEGDEVGKQFSGREVVVFKQVCDDGGFRRASGRRNGPGRVPRASGRRKDPGVPKASGRRKGPGPCGVVG